MAERQLAQINIATLQHPEGDERVVGFFENLDRINALAESSDGFIWRLQDEESGNATGIELSHDPLLIVNMSVWRDVQALHDFVYRTAHAEIMAQRTQWFERSADAYQALWWIEPGRFPRIEQGLARLRLLQRKGPGKKAFTFKTVGQFSDG